MYSNIRPTHGDLTGWFLRIWHWGDGWCIRCGYPWRVREPHTVWHLKNEGCDVLCQECWHFLDDWKSRIYYYVVFVEDVIRDVSRMPSVVSAVRSGK